MDSIKEFICSINTSINPDLEDYYVSNLLDIMYKRPLNKAFKDLIITLIKTNLFNQKLQCEYVEKKYIKVFNDVMLIISDLDDFNNICSLKIIDKLTNSYHAISGNYYENYIKEDNGDEIKYFYEYDIEGNELRKLIYRYHDKKTELEEIVRKRF